MYPPIKGLNGEDIIQFRVSQDGLSISTYDGTNPNQHLKGVRVLITPTNELIDFTLEQIKQKEQEDNKTPEEKAVEEPKPIGVREKNFNLLLETSKGMVENLVNNVKTILKEVGVAFEKVKVLTNTKGSDKSVFDTNVKDLGIQADNVEGYETDVKTSQTVVDDALGKNFRTFISAYTLFAQQNDYDMEYGLQDAVGESTTPFGTYTSDGTVLGGELYIWAEYLEFLQLFPEFKDRNYLAYFDYVKNNPKWAEEARERLQAGMPTNVGELKGQPKTVPTGDPMSEEEKNVIRDALGMNLERIRENKLSVNKIKALLPERYRVKFSNLTFLGDGTGNILRMTLTEGYEDTRNPGGEEIVGINTDEGFIKTLENIAPLFANSPKVSLEQLQEISVRIDDELMDISAKIQEWFERQKVKERPEEPNENSEIFQRNEDLIASIDSLQVFGILVEGKEFSLFDELTAFLEENYVPVRIIDKVIDPISVISEFFSEISRIKEGLSELKQKPQESINEGLVAQILNLEELQEKFNNAEDELKQIFEITGLEFENFIPGFAQMQMVSSQVKEFSPEFEKFAEKVVDGKSKKTYTFMDLLEIPEARNLIDDIESGSSFAEEAKQILKTKFGYDYDAVLKAKPKETDEFETEVGLEQPAAEFIVNQGYQFT